MTLIMVIFVPKFVSAATINVSKYSYTDEYIQKLETAYEQNPSVTASSEEIVMWIDSCIYNGEQGIEKLFILTIEECQLFNSSLEQLDGKYTFGLDGVWWSRQYSQIVDYVRKAKVDANNEMTTCEKCRLDTGNQDCMEYNGGGNETRECYDFAEVIENERKEKLESMQLWNTIRGQKIMRVILGYERESSGGNYAVVPDSGGDVIDNLTTLTDSIWATIITIVQAVAVGCVIFAGLRYMYASADKKADIKRGMIYLAIGAMFVFATSSVMRFIFSIGNSLL